MKKESTPVFYTHNDKNDIVVYGTCLQGAIETSYAKLKKILGKPHNGDEYKVDAEWDIEFEDGTVATIYNWKNGKNYKGKYGLSKTKITDWHIGGYNSKVLDKVKELLNL